MNTIHILFKNIRERTLPNVLFLFDTITRQTYLKKRNLETNIPHEYTYKNTRYFINTRYKYYLSSKI